MQGGHVGQLVLAGDGQLGLLERAFVHFQPGFLGVLKLGAFGDEALQHFAAQFGFVWRSAAA